MTCERKHRAWFTALVVVMAMSLPGIAYAQDTKDTADDTAAAEATEEKTEDTEKTEGEPDEIASVLSTLPVLGSGLDVTITRDVNGEIESVSLDPSGATPVKEGDHKVMFLMEDGDTEVVVKSAGGIVQTKVKADATEDVSGDGAWSGDVFGTGTVSVPYSVSFDGITPTIAVGTISAPADVTATVGEGKVKTSDDGDRSFYAVKVELTSGEETAILGLVAKVKVTDEGETKVEVSSTLLSRDRVECWFGDRDRHDKWDRDDDDDRWDRDDDKELSRDDDRWDREDRWDRDHDDDRWDDDRDDDRDGDDDRDRDHDDDDSDRGDRDDD